MASPRAQPLLAEDDFERRARPRRPPTDPFPADPSPSRASRRSGHTPANAFFSSGDECSAKKNVNAKKANANDKLGMLGRHMRADGLTAKHLNPNHNAAAPLSHLRPLART